MNKRTVVFCMVLAVGLALYLLKSGDRLVPSSVPEEQAKQGPQSVEQSAQQVEVTPGYNTTPSAPTASGDFDGATKQATKPLNKKAVNKKPVLRAATGGYLNSRMPPLPRGVASLRLDERDVSPSNFSGHYQRIQMEAEASAKIELQWSGVGADRPIFLHAIHGGRINGESGTTLKTNSHGQIVFNFETNADPGRYEILVRSGTSEEVLHFWVPTGEPGVDIYGI